MTKVVYSMNVSVDGYISDRDGEIAVPPPDEELHRFHNERVRVLGTHLCGRRLYEVMSVWDDYAESNPSAPEHELEFARIWSDLPKVVFSTTLEDVGPNARLLREVRPEQIAELREETEGDIGVGGAGLASTFLELGLIDEFRPIVHPVVAGGGTPFLPGAGTRFDLRLVETRAVGSGVVDLRYERLSAR